MGFKNDIQWYTLKKIGVLANPQKWFRRFLKVSKCVDSLKKRRKISTEPIKILPVYPGAEPSYTKPFLSCVGKMRNL